MMLTHFGLVSSCLDRPHPSYLVPWYFPEKRPASLDNNWTPAADSSQVGKTTAKLGNSLLE